MSRVAPPPPPTGNHATTPPGATPDILRSIREAAHQTGIDFPYLMAQAAQESSFDPGARSQRSSATGLYQFIRSTWNELFDKYAARHGYGDVLDRLAAASQGKGSETPSGIRREILALRENPDLSARMAAEYARENQEFLIKHLKRPPDHTELYLSHFMGPGGALDFIREHAKNPRANAGRLYPEAAQGNPGIFLTPAGTSRTLGEIRALMAEKIEGRFPDLPSQDRDAAPAPAGPPERAAARPPAPWQDEHPWSLPLLHLLIILDPDNRKDGSRLVSPSRTGEDTGSPSP